MAARSQEASSSTSPCRYHVFLSFTGEDTRKTFTDHLYTALVHAGFHTFREDEEIKRGEDIKSELQKAIQESGISIVVLSMNYASCSWCLDELVVILKRRRTSGHIVLPIFYDVEASQVRKQMGSFKEAFKRHEEKIEAETGERKKEWKTKVEVWKAALREVADLAGMPLRNQDDGHESRFIQKIVGVVRDKLSRTILDDAPYLIGINYRATNVHLWLQDDSADVSIVAICGMGGIGKTTIAKFLYNLNFSRFEGSSFLANVREMSKHQDGLLHLQRQLLSDILKGRNEEIYNIDEGIVKIKDVICCKRVLVVLDDVDKLDVLDAVLGMQDWVFPGVKIIITTRHEQLIKAHEVFQVHRVRELDHDESLELFSWHAFGQSSPIDDYAEVSKMVVQHCGGLPLAIKVLGSSLSGKSIEVWKSQLEKLKAIPENEILEKLKISYDFLQDDHDKGLFLHVACFFVGKDKDFTVTILDGCGFYTKVGIQNLIDRCLLAINDLCNKLVMHQLLQQMGREIVRQESPKEPGERSILWSHKDSFDVLRQNTGTGKIEGLILDTCLVKEDNFARPVFGVNSPKSLRFGIWKLLSSAPANSNQVALEADAFARMCNLKLLHLSYVQLNGSYENFPKEIRWLYWHHFPFESMPSDFPLESVVALEMPYSSFKNVWKGTKFLELLKFLNLSHSQNLAKTPNFSELPNLERLILENCVGLVEVHESVGQLERLVFLNLKDCKSLRKLPRSIGMLESLETLDISGCSNLDHLPTEMGNMDSLAVLRAADLTGISRSLSTVREVKAWSSFIWPSLLKPRKSPEISWASLPLSLVELSLAHCNLSDDDFPRDISNLFSLKTLNLSDNPMCSLPDCIRGLAGLQILHIHSCTRLRTIEVRQKLQELVIGGNTSLEKLTFPSASDRAKITRYTDKCDSLVEFMGVFKLEPLENVDNEIINNMGLSDLESMEKPTIQLDIGPAGVHRKLSLQGCHETHIFCTYLPGSKVPPWFSFTSIGSSISFTVPSHDLNFRVRGLSVGSVYGRCPVYDSTAYTMTHTIVSNTIKGLIWSHRPQVFGVPEAGEDMMWLSYWKFENQVEGGDEINVSVIGGELYQVKEVGVHLVYEEQEKNSSQSANEEEEVSQQIYPYGNVVPGNVSADLGSTKFYQLGKTHVGDCKYCPPLCPWPWRKF